MENKLKIYVDESGNNGPIDYDFTNDRLNYDQRYFSLCFFMPQKDEQYYIDKYINFKKKYLGNENEIVKGTTLMTRKYNEALRTFIKEFINSEEFYINLYDKKFLLVTHIAYCVFGPGHRKKRTREHFQYIDILINQKDSYFRKFFEVTQNCNQDTTKELIKYMIEYDYEISNKTQYQNLYFMKILLKRYLEDIGVINAMTDELSDYDCGTLITPNLQALGENLLVIKVENPDLKCENIEFIHDRSSFVEKNISKFLPNLNIRFENNENDIFLQIADNVASIFNKLQTEILKQDYMEISEFRKNWHFKQFRMASKKLGTQNIKYCLDVMRGAYLRAFADFEETMEDSEFGILLVSILQLHLEDLDFMNWDIIDAYDMAVE